MKVKYQFVNESIEIEVDEYWSAVIAELDRQEFNVKQKETRRHCSLEQLDLETNFPDDTDSLMDFLNSAEIKAVYEALSKLSPRHRHLLEAVYMDGRSLTEVAKEEGRSVAAIHYALATARQKFKKFYENP